MLSYQSLKTKASIHRVINYSNFGDFDPFVQLNNCGQYRQQMQASADLFLSCSIWLKYHQITGWNSLISSHIMQLVLHSEIKLCSALKKSVGHSSDICQSEQCRPTCSVLTQTCLEALLEAQGKQHIEAIGTKVWWLRLLSTLSKF